MNLGNENTDVKTVATQILLCCNNFIEQTFYLRKFAEVAYNSIFAASIADLVSSQ